MRRTKNYSANRESEFIRFCVIQAAYWGYQAALPGFLISRMLAEGMPQTMLSFVLAANMLCCFLGSVFWGRRIDREQANKKYFILCNVLCLGMGMLLYTASKSPAWIAVLYPLYGFLTSHGATTLDAWVIIQFPERTDAVGRSRSFATLSYAVTMLWCGILIKRLGYGVMPAAGSIFLLISAVCAMLQRESEAMGAGSLVKGSTASEKGFSAESIKKLTESGNYMILLISVFLTGLCVQPINNMMTVLIENAGGDVSMIGYNSFIGCIIQAPFLLFSGKLQRFSAQRRMQAAIIAPLFYALFCMFAKSPALIILGGVCNNISFGLIFPAMREITERNVARNVRNTAHALIDVAYGSFAGMLGLLYSGLLIGRAGIKAMLLVCLVLQAAAVIIQLRACGIAKTPQENCEKLAAARH